MTRFELTYDIPPDLFKKAMQLPIAERSKWKTLLINAGAALLAVIGTVLLLVASEHLMGLDGRSVVIGFALGFVFLLVIWHLQHRKHVRFHTDHDAGTGRNHLVLDASGVQTSKPYIETKMTWDFVKGFRVIAGATLIDLGAVRLIVPDAALPQDVMPGAFLTQLKTWKGAA